MITRTGRINGRGSTDFGGVAWLVLAVYVAAYDMIALRSNKHSTLSATFYRFSSGKMGRPTLILFWFYLTSHLFRWIPKKYDIFRRFFG